MCQGKPSGTPKNLHETICHVTHGVPCKTVHALGKLFNQVIGREPKKDCCGGPGQKAQCSCGSKHEEQL